MDSAGEELLHLGVFIKCGEVVVAVGIFEECVILIDYHRADIEAKAMVASVKNLDSKRRLGEIKEGFELSEGGALAILLTENLLGVGERGLYEGSFEPFLWGLDRDFSILVERDERF